MTRAKGHMDPALFDRLLGQAAGWTELLLLHLGGEPTLHPQLDEILRICRRRGVPSLLSTNAALLDEGRRAALHANPPDILIFSIDAVDEQTYGGVGRTGSFRQTCDNVRAYLRERGDAAGPPLTMVQLILMKQNAHQADDFARQWREAGADLVRLKPYVDFPGVDDFHGTGQAARGRGRCIYLWRQMAVLWNGRAVACCLDMEGVTDMGDAATTPLADIWNGPAYQSLRQLHVEGRAGEVAPCSTCSMPQLSPWQLIGLLSLDAATLKSLLPRYEALMRQLPGLDYLS